MRLGYWSKRGKWRAALAAGGMLVMAGAALGWWWRGGGRVGQEVADARVIGDLVMAEETYLELGPRMALLSSDVAAMRLPGEKSADLFAAGKVRVADAGALPGELDGKSRLQWMEWPVESVGERGREGLVLWGSVLGAVDWFEHAKVYLVKGEHPGGEADRYRSSGGFEGLGFLKVGVWASFRASLDLEFRREGGEWRIVSWETRKFEVATVKERLFTEVLDKAVSGGAEELRRCGHEAASVRYYESGQKEVPHPYFAPISSNHKPGLAVVDVNGDGWDDLYVMVRIGKNRLLVNRGDGTFAEESARYGLDLPGHTTCAVFADFDNDGDPDALLGRSLLKTAYLENRGGVYVQHKAPDWSPMAVVSMSAADYNRDGLLDVYLCTYRPAAPPQSSPSGGVAVVAADDFDWMDEFLPPVQATEYRRRLKAERSRSPDGAFPELLDQVGPPNMLLVNRGRGVFEPAPENAVVGLWKNTLQATWGDYDRDGDVDLYVANDWAPDNLLRNDGEAGFVDVTKEAGITSYGFAMGASWGDYDNDGKEDVYVSNMYSKAGRRITAMVPGLSASYVESAQGNWLYRQEADGRFRQVAGLERPSMTVMKAGWSWGGKFADFDNDGWLDLYVLSGYFTAPPGLTSELDL